MSDRAAMPATTPGADTSFTEALGAIERARAGQGSVLVAEAWSAGATTPHEVLDALLSLAQADGWGVARAVGGHLDRARPLALVRRLLLSCGGAPTTSESVRLTAARLRGCAAARAAASPGGCALLLVEDAHLASRACLRTLGELGPTLSDVPVVLALGFAQPRALP